ncbi:MAG: phosphogluconate dehydrogenase (NADP(+)-dependent, decarboxylating) [Blastocatellia bacterium]
MNYMTQARFGMIGLGTMGRNFLLNVAEHQVRCIGYDIDPAKRELLITAGGGLPIAAAESVSELTANLEQPRKIMLLVPAGPVVDKVIAELKPFLSTGDIIIDAGNSHFTDTERRIAELADSGINFIGIGVSGGEEGARHGASIMAGGSEENYERIRPILEAAAARIDGETCAAFVGAGSAGHFVKMVHNGIEYGMMQLIAETYDLLRRGWQLEPGEVADLFEDWNGGELSSFLMEVSIKVLRKKDEETGKPLVKLILDTAGQKGTGKWTSQAAMDFGVPVPTIDSAVTMRQISAMKDLRKTFSETYHRDMSSHHIELNPESLRKALFGSIVITYSQGFALIVEASREKKFGSDPALIASIWRGGCIIRSKFLSQIKRAFTENAHLAHLLLDKEIAGLLNETIIHLRKTVSAYNGRGIASMCFSSALAYFDALRAERLPANLIQAQRDFFGAHTYQRIDKAGIFHTANWEDEA